MMATKADLDKIIRVKNDDINRLNERVSDLEGDVNSWKGRFEAVNKIVPQLKHSIAELERANARLEGYVERINQQDQAGIIADSPMPDQCSHAPSQTRPMPFVSPNHAIISPNGFTEVDWDIGYHKEERKKWYEL